MTWPGVSWQALSRCIGSSVAVCLSSVAVYLFCPIPSTYARCPPSQHYLSLYLLFQGVSRTAIQNPLRTVLENLCRFTDEV